jgi:hypothetical protein
VYYGEQLTPEEKILVTGAPDFVSSLLENVPRLDPVIQILTALTWTDEQIARLGDGTIGQASRILGLVLDYDTLVAQGHAAGVAVQTLRSRAARFGESLVEQFGAHVGAGSSAQELREMPLRTVRPGMIIMQDVHTHMGTLLIARGFEVTDPQLQRAIRVVLQRLEHDPPPPPPQRPALPNYYQTERY